MMLARLVSVPSETGASFRPSRSARMREVLKNETDAAAVLLDFAATERGQVLTVDEDLAFARALLQQQQAQKGRLAGAARAGQENEFSFLNGERQVPQGVQPATVDLREMVRLDHVFVRIAYLTPNAQLPTPKHIPTPNSQTWKLLEFEDWAWLVVGRWALGR